MPIPQLPKEYDQLDQWNTLMFLYNAALQEIQTRVNILSDEFQHINNYNPIEHVKARIKTAESIVSAERSGNEVYYHAASPRVARLVADLMEEEAEIYVL